MFCFAVVQNNSAWHNLYETEQIMADIDKINELIGNKDFENALAIIKPAMVEEPANIKLKKLAGLAEVNLENWSEAKVLFETVIKYNPEDAVSLFYLANCYDHLGEFISAKNTYINVINMRKEYVEAYKNLCVVLIKLNQFSEAMRYACMAGVIDSEEYLFDFILGTCYMKLKEFQKSVEPFERALKKAPDNIGVYNSLGTAYIATERSEDAIKCYLKALEIDAENPMVYYNLGSAYQIQKNHEEACKYLKKAVEIDEEDESFSVALAMSMVKLEKYKEASEIYKKLMVMHPEKDNYKYNLVTCYEAIGEYKSAIAMLEGFVHVNTKFILPAQKLASLYIKTNQLSKAKEIYDSILLKNNPTADTMHQYAVLSSSLCDTDTAEKILKKVIKMNPDIAKAHKDLAVIYLNKRLFDYADDEFKTAIKLAPNDFEILFEYGNFLYSISKNTEAERYYLESLEIEPNNVLALTFMALNKLVLNQLDESKNYIMKALEIDHHHEYIQFCAGRILYARGEYEDAKRYLVRAVEQNPDIETQNTLALTYYELGEYQSAINIFNNLLSKHPDNVSLLMSIAKCYEALKDNDKALEYLDKLVDIFPENEDAHEMIRKLS